MNKEKIIEKQFIETVKQIKDIIDSIEIDGFGYLTHVRNIKALVDDLEAELEALRSDEQHPDLKGAEDTACNVCISKSKENCDKCFLYEKWNPILWKTAKEVKEKYHSITEEVCEGYQHEHILQAMQEYASLPKVAMPTDEEIINEAIKRHDGSISFLDGAKWYKSQIK